MNFEQYRGLKLGQELAAKSSNLVQTPDEDYEEDDYHVDDEDDDDTDENGCEGLIMMISPLLLVITLSDMIIFDTKLQGVFFFFTCTPQFQYQKKTRQLANHGLSQ